MTVAPDIVEFLRRYPPFNELDPMAVEHLGSAVEIEFHPAGEIIFSQGGQPMEFLRVIRAGAVEVLNDGQVLDLMGQARCSATRRCSRACRPGSRRGRSRTP